MSDEYRKNEPYGARTYCTNVTFARVRVGKLLALGVVQNLLGISENHPRFLLVRATSMRAHLAPKHFETDEMVPLQNAKRPQ